MLDYLCSSRAAHQITTIHQHAAEIAINMAVIARTCWLGCKMSFKSTKAEHQQRPRRRLLLDLP